MRSKARFLKAHPLHPMLIPFPLAFLIGAFVFDLVGRLLEQPALWTTGAYLSLAGIAMAVVAAVPGLIDYLYTVPPDSSGRRRATQHMVVNLGAVGLFIGGWWLRAGPGEMPGLVLLGMEAVAAALLVAGGWMGGTLVYRNQIGVDHRYAGAGKWREAEAVAWPGELVAVARRDELAVDQMKLVRIGARRIVLARTDQGYVAFDDHCTHKGGSLAGGVMMCGTVQCPWHGSQFDTATGAVRAGPAQRPISTYAVEESGDVVRLRFEPPRQDRAEPREAAD